MSEACSRGFCGALALFVVIHNDIAGVVKLFVTPG